MAKEEAPVEESVIREIVNEVGVGFDLGEGKVVNVTNLDPALVEIYAHILKELSELRKAIG